MIQHTLYACDLAYAVDEPWRTFFYMLAYSGLRWGEAAALRRKDCRILASKIHVVKSLSEVGGQLYFGEPKSRESIRWVGIPEFLADMLARHLGEEVSADPEALVFTAPRGGPLRYANFRKRVWIPAVKAAGLSEKTCIHDLRHTAASFMIFEGAHLVLVQRQLGHSSIVVTQRYAHLYPSQVEELAVLLDVRRRGNLKKVVGL